MPPLYLFEHLTEINEHLTDKRFMADDEDPEDQVTIAELAKLAPLGM